MKARISQLHKTEAEWKKLDFIPAAGELIVYDADLKYPYSRVKVGDGVHKVSDLSFFAEAAIEAVLKAHEYSEIIDCGNILDYIN